MKKIYKIMTLILVAAMLLCTCACSGSGSSKKANIVGNWSCDYDITDVLMDAISSEAGVDMDITERMILVINLDLNKDGTCKLSIDKDASAENLEKFMPAFSASLTDAMYQIGEEQGVSNDDFDAAFIAEYGCTVAEYVEQNIVTLLDFDSLFDEIDDVDGFYKVNKDELKLSEDKDDFEGAAICKFELKGDTLSILSISENGSDVEDFIEDFNMEFPIEFTR